MKKLFAMVLCLVLAVTIVGCGKITYRIGITIPSDSTDDFVWSDEEISPNGRKITIHSCDELGDAEIILKPIEVKEENAYDEPVVIARGKSLTLNAEKGAWFKIGIRMLNNAVPGKVKYFEIKDIEVRISSEDVTAQENSVMHGRILEIADGNLSIEAGGKNYIVYDWMEYIPTGPSFEIGDEVEITYNGITLEENPSGLCGVSKIDLTHDEYIRKYGNEGNDDLPDGALAICIDGVTYYGIGFPVPVEPDESAIEYVEIPAGHGDATITAFARLEEGKLIVCRIDGEWYQFHSLEALASSQVNVEK